MWSYRRMADPNPRRALSAVSSHVLFILFRITMKLTTQRDLIRAVAAEWRRQYEPFTNDDKQIAEKLDALDKETATAADVAAIIGNESWTRLTCDECGENTDAVLTVGQEPDYESHTASLCRSCVERAYSIPWMNVDVELPPNGGSESKKGVVGG